jgi:protein MpaA
MTTNASSEPDKPSEEYKSTTGDGVDELNQAYKQQVELQTARLELEEAVFRQIEADKELNKITAEPELLLFILLGQIIALARFIYRHVSRAIKHVITGYPKLSLAAASFILLLLITAGLMLTVIPQTINYNFSKSESCIISPSLFPDFFHYTDSNFKLSRPSLWSISGVTIFSDRLCAAPIKAPASFSSYQARQSAYLLDLAISKKVLIDTKSYPKVNAVTLTVSSSKNLSLIHPLEFKLSAPDKTFNYVLSGNGKTSPCSKENLTLDCSLTPLSLSYDSTYELAVVREFNQQLVATAYQNPVRTITAVAITQSSISPGSTVYSIPTDVTLQTNKTLINLDDVTLSYSANNKTINVPITAKYSGKNIVISFANPLPRQTQFNLHIANMTASDQSQLEQAYNLAFTTSGGPAVIDSNIPSFGLAFGQAMTVDFDQPLMPSQDLSQFVSLIVNGTEQPATITSSGQQVTIVPTNSYPVCAAVKVQILSGIESNYGISGNSAWSYNTRSHCYTAFSIGTSVDGRPITAYQFGNGPSMVLFIAAMEGNEQNSANLLQRWIPDVDANPGKIPSYRTLVIIPQINPDGYAADTRLNADGVDLNRNFPANNWSEQVTEPTAPDVWTNDGGPYPLSEPESQAIATYTQNNQPTLTLTMHSHGGIVEANDAGDSIALGAEYAHLADYGAIPTYEIGNFFDYTTTGAYEDWLNDKLNLPALEVELESATNDEYSRNLPALWTMAEIPPN